jgi:hypothetical protein
MGWIATKWKSKSHFDIQLGSKGFFTIIFSRLEDKDRIMDGGPYFFNYAGLYLHNWVERFNPDKEDFTWAQCGSECTPSQDYWDEETL